MKKAIALFTSLMILSMTLAGCGAAKETSSEETTAQAAAETQRPLGKMRGITATELIAEMGTGWNLGNTLDAEGGETGWGNPTTTKEMIDEVHNAGFNTIRIRRELRILR